MPDIQKKLKSFVKRDFLDVLLLLLCAFVGWYAYEASNTCSQYNVRDIEEVVKLPEIKSVHVEHSEMKKGATPLIFFYLTPAPPPELQQDQSGDLSTLKVIQPI